MKRPIDPKTEKLAYTVPEVAIALSIGESTVWQLIRGGQISVFKIGILTRVTKDELAAFIARCNAEALARTDLALIRGDASLGQGSGPLGTSKSPPQQQ